MPQILYGMDNEAKIAGWASNILLRMMFAVLTIDIYFLYVYSLFQIYFTEFLEFYILWME